MDEPLSLANTMTQQATSPIRSCLCASSDLIDGGKGIRFELSRHGEPLAAFAIHHHGRVHAYLNRCGHVPVELDWQPGEFFDDSRIYLICSTHGAIYDPTTGACLGGRCNGRGLEALPIEECGGQVYLLEEY